MRKLDYIRRQPGISDYNLLVDMVNQLIDRIQAKIEIEEVAIAREIKDFKFFNDEEQQLPFHTTHTLTSLDDASKIFNKYALTYKEMNKINELISNNKIVSLVIDVTEAITEKEEKQEAMFETIKTEVIEEEKPKKKKGRKKKTSRA